MVHKRLQRHIIREDGLRRLGTNTSIRSSGVGSRGVELREKETSLRAAGVTDNETWQRETVSKEVLISWLARDAVM